MPETSRNDQNQSWTWQGWVVILFGVSILGCGIAYFVLAASLRDHDPFSADTTDPNMIEGNAEIILPPSASNMQSHHEGLRDIAVQVRFAMSADDLPEFLKHTQCTSDLMATDIRQRLQEHLDRSWWMPSNAQKFEWCSGGREDFFQTVFIDMTDPETYLVYVVAGTM